MQETNKEMKELITKILPREKNARILFFLIIAGIFILGGLVGNLDENDTLHPSQINLLQHVCNVDF